MNILKAIVLLSMVLLIGLCTISAASAQQQNSSSVTVVVSMLLLDSQSTRKELSISWQRPVMRENNVALNANEIDYYRLRHRRIGASAYSTKIIYTPTTSINLSLSGEPGDLYELAIQTVDTNGFASRYTDSAIVTFTEPEKNARKN